MMCAAMKCVAKDKKQTAAKTTEKIQRRRQDNVLTKTRYNGGQQVLFSVLPK